MRSARQNRVLTITSAELQRPSLASQSSTPLFSTKKRLVFASPSQFRSSILIQTGYDKLPDSYMTSPKIEQLKRRKQS